MEKRPLLPASPRAVTRHLLACRLTAGPAVFLGGEHKIERSVAKTPPNKHETPLFSLAILGQAAVVHLSDRQQTAATSDGRVFFLEKLVEPTIYLKGEALETLSMRMSPLQWCKKSIGNLLKKTCWGVAASAAEALLVGPYVETVRVESSESKV